MSQLSTTRLLLIVLFISSWSCTPKEEMTGDFQLLPSPQQFEQSGNSDLVPAEIRYYYGLEGVDTPVLGDMLKSIAPAASEDEAQVVFGLDAALDVGAEGYVLEISEKLVMIQGKDEAGLLYGFVALEQLMEDATDQQVPLPTCIITDYPLLAYRAIHIDIKHHREKTAYYYQLMDRLSQYKINAVIAEVEDKIKYERQPLVGSADALTIDEWKSLSAYAKERNIEISPLVQGLGHASFILKHEEYKDLRDDPESDWAFNPLNPKTYEVQFDLYLDAMEATPYGKYLHVGGDEVRTTGRNSGKSPLELNLIWLNKVTEFAEDHGRIPIFWDDMPLKFAGVIDPIYDTEMTTREVDSIWEQNESTLVEFIDQFPDNCIYMRWNYWTPGTYGNLKTMDWFTSHGFQVMGATAGQTRWVLMPQNGSNIENIRSFALSSISKGLDGLLLTLWDDDSPHFELYMRGISAFAEYTWSGEKRSMVDVKSAYRHRAFGSALSDDNYAFIDKLEEPVAFWRDVLLKEGTDRRYLISMEEASEGIIDLPDRNKKGAWTDKNAVRLEKARELLAIVDSVSVRIDEAKRVSERNLYTLEVYEQVTNLVRFSYETLIALEVYDTPSEVLTEEEALKSIQLLNEKFALTRSELEAVYAQTRILNKPEGYILDQDHHHHSANQTGSFDWQFISEILLMEEINNELLKLPGSKSVP